MKQYLWPMSMALILSCNTAAAAVNDEVIAELRATIAALSQRVAELEQSSNAATQAAAQSRQTAEQASQQVAQVAAQVEAVNTANAAPSWVDRISLKGDFRYRYQNDDDQSADSERNRQRIRARPVLIAQLPNNVEVGFGLATGSDSPVSSNQTLGGGGSSKGIYMDLAYFDWQASSTSHVIAGKFENKLVRAGDHSMLWDGDWRPEGAQLTFDNGSFFGTALGTWLESDSNSNQEFGYGLQAGARGALGRIGLSGGVGYYSVDAAGVNCYYKTGECFGNSVTSGGTYRYDFAITEIFAEAKTDITDLPVSLFVDYANNGDAGQFDTGISAGLTLGKAKKTGSWEVGYVYQDLEADAVLGLLTDSDFAGGGSDSKGHILKAAYALNDKIRTKLTYSMAKRQDSNGIENGGVPYDFDTLFLEMEFKYD